MTKIWGNKMTLPELSKLISSKSMLLIRVETLTNHRSDLTFVGTLDEYVEAIKTLGGAAIFVSTICVTEDRFTYSPNRMENPIGMWPFPTTTQDEEIETENEEIEEYDLCSVAPELARYKEKIGADGYFELSACNLTYSIYEQWMQEMEILRIDAQELIDQEIEEEEEARLAVQEEAQAEEIAKLETAVKKLHALVSDRNFSRLPTQLAMRAYAIDKIPELDNLDDSELKREIQTVAAQIQARNLGRNSR